MEIELMAAGLVRSVNDRCQDVELIPADVHAADVANDGAGSLIQITTFTATAGVRYDVLVKRTDARIPSMDVYVLAPGTDYDINEAVSSSVGFFEGVHALII